MENSTEWKSDIKLADLFLASLLPSFVPVPVSVRPPQLNSRQAMKKMSTIRRPRIHEVPKHRRIRIGISSEKGRFPREFSSGRDVSQLLWRPKNLFVPARTFCNSSPQTYRMWCTGLLCCSHRSQFGRHFLRTFARGLDDLDELNSTRNHRIPAGRKRIKTKQVSQKQKDR